MGGTGEHHLSSNFLVKLGLYDQSQVFLSHVEYWPTTNTTLWKTGYTKGRSHMEK
jgi:hypothetical protein